MPSLSLNVGLNNGRKLPFGGGAAPTEISVATTNTIIVTGTSDFNGTYTKQFASSYQSPTSDYLNFDFTLGSPPRWYFNDGDADYLESSPQAFNALFIPRAFASGVTLTAA